MFIFFQQSVFSKDDHHNISHLTCPCATWPFHFIVKKWISLSTPEIWTGTVTALTNMLRWKWYCFNSEQGLYMAWKTSTCYFLELRLYIYISRVYFILRKIVFFNLKFKLKWVSCVCICWMWQPYLEASKYTRGVINLELPCLRSSSWVTRPYSMRHHVEGERSQGISRHQPYD